MAMSEQEIYTSRVPIETGISEEPPIVLPGCITVDFGNGKYLIASSLEDIEFVEKQVKFSRGATDSPTFHTNGEVWKRNT